jgi:hypothetical protein
MKNSLKSLSAILILSALMLTGCAQFADGGGSVWQGGLGILPVLTFLGAAIFGYQAYKGSKSGSIKLKDGYPTGEEGGNVPIWKFGQFWFSVALLLATIFIILNVISNR